MNCAFKYSSFSCKIFCLIILRECYVNFHFFTDLGSDKLILKSRNERTWSDRQRIFFAFSAFKSLAVNKALKIKDNLVFVLNGPVCHFYCSCTALQLFLDFLVNFFLCNSCRNFIHFQTFIFAKRYFRFHCNLCCEDERFAFLKLCDIHFWLGYDFKLAFIVSFSVCLWYHMICSLIIEHFRSVHLFDHLTRYFALTKSRKADLAAFFQVCCLKCFLHILRRHLDRQFRHIMF